MDLCGMFTSVARPIHPSVRTMKASPFSSVTTGIALLLLSASPSPAADIGASDPPLDERQLNERSYQQDLARARAVEAKALAALQTELATLDAPQKYERLMAVAQEQCAAGAFPQAIATFNKAMANKPAEIAVSSEVAQLKAILLAQSKSVEVTFVSDGKTFVAVSGVRLLATFATMTFPLLPGDYDVIGRRKGYQDVRLHLRIRNGEPTPVQRVVCTVITPATS
jgi:hypothetical protein